MTILFPIFLFSLLFKYVHTIGPAPVVERLTDRFDRVGVNQSFDTIFGGKNVRVMNDGSGVTLALDKSSGSGMESRSRYFHGFFNAALKLPAGFSSGVVVAFYLSNGDVYPHNHDELDFELLGHENKRTWILQTNMYGDGSVGTGREEKFNLWFDPTQDFHDYSILWNDHHIVYFVDNVPIREVVHNKVLGSIYPSKPMSAYITIWDGSQWATHGGKYPVDYKYAPFVISIRTVELEGCVMVDQDNVGGCMGRSPSSLDPVDGEVFAKLSSQQVAALNWARGKHMVYSYCKDRFRYKVMPPEC